MSNKNEYDNYELVINDQSCDGYEGEFSSWVEENYPGVTTRIAAESGAFYDPDGLRVDERECPNFWEEFNSN